jgi:hypothetical protein
MQPSRRDEPPSELGLIHLVSFEAGRSRPLIFGWHHREEEDMRAISVIKEGVEADLHDRS